MVRAARVSLAVVIAATAVFAADSPFAGTWKLNPAKSELMNEQTLRSLSTTVR